MNRIITLVKPLWGDRFVRASGLFFIATMVSNIINYLFQITMGRLLAVEKYGEMNSLFSITMLLSMVYLPVSNYFARNTSHYSALNKNEKIKALFHFAYTKFGVGFLVFILIMMSFSSIIGKYIHTQPDLVLLTFIFGIVSISTVINNGFIQGLQKFKLLSIIIILLALFKYIFSIIFVYMKLEVHGILYGVILSGILIGIFSYISLKREIISHPKNDEKIKNTSIIDYLMPMVLANFIFGGLTQGDLILVKHFFSPYESGIYASAAIISKSILYLPTAIIYSLFPMVSAENAKNNDTLHLLLKALLMNSVIAGIGVIALNAAPNFIVRFFFGVKYIASVEIIGLFSVVMFFMGFIAILMNYFLALGKVKFVIGLLISLIIEVVGIYLLHNKLREVLIFMLVSSLFSCVIFLILIINDRKKIRKL